MAISGPLAQKVKSLPKGSPMGLGQDFWLCHCARKNGMKSFIDGRVSVYHPPGIGYNEAEAHAQMEETFSKIGGQDFRQSLFRYREDFLGNLAEESDYHMKAQEEEVVPAPKSKNNVTIVTVDNGWAYADFVRVTSAFPNCRRIVMMKGLSLAKAYGRKWINILLRK